MILTPATADQWLQRYGDAWERADPFAAAQLFTEDRAGRRFAYLGSLLVIILGMCSLALKGIDLGIEFVGGTEIVLRFKNPPSIADLRSSLVQTGLSASDIKTFGTEGDILIRTREQEAGTAVGDTIRSALQQSFPQASFEVLKQYKVSPKIGKELRRDALYAVIASLIVILGYIAIRFKFIYGVGAVVALFHDVLATLGTISLLNGVIPQLHLEITLEVIAAFLTLVGVSVNDTVVVFEPHQGKREDLSQHGSVRRHEQEPQRNPFQSVQ